MAIKSKIDSIVFLREEGGGWLKKQWNNKFEKGKPIVRLGRKAMGLYED